MKRRRPLAAPPQARGIARAVLLRRIAIGFAALLLVLVGLAFWLLRTESGLQFVLARAVGATEGKLEVGASSGHLAGPVTLERVRYLDTEAGFDVQVRRVEIEYAPLELLASRLHVTRLDVEGVDVAVTSVPPTEPSPDAGEFSLEAPLDIVLDRLVLADAKLAQDGIEQARIDSLDVVGRWTREGLAVQSLALKSPDGEVDLHGTVSALPGYPGDGELGFRWRVQQVDYAGTLSARGDGRSAQLDLSLAQPTPARLVANLTQSDDFPWTAHLEVPRFDPRLLQPEAGLAALALSLEGSGDRDSGTLAGEAGLNDHRVLLDTLRYAIDGQRLVVEALSVRSPEASGVLNAQGSVQLDAEPVSGEFALDWQGVELPADLVGQTLATHGKLDASGSAERYQASGTLALGPPGALSDIALRLEGTPEVITLHQLALQQPNGGLDAKGTIELQPGIAWDLVANARRFDPGAYAADWPGALDFELASKGRMTDQGPDATLLLSKLGGTLRKRPVSGSADLALEPGYVVDGKLDLVSGKSRIAVIGRGGDRTDAAVTLAIASLGDWLPDAGGALEGDFRVQGQWPALAVDGAARGSRLAFGDTRIGSLDLRATLDSIQPPRGRVDLGATDLSTAGLVFDTLELDGSGSAERHDLELSAKGPPAHITLALGGALRDDGRWNGNLRTLDLAIKDAPRLALEAPAQLAWDGQRFSAQEICLAGGGPRVCLSGDGGADGALAARYRIERLPVELLARLAAPDAPLRVEGMLDGSGDIRRDAAGALGGQATIQSASGRIAWPEEAAQPLLEWSGLALDARLSPQSTHATLRAALDHGGRIDGDLTLSGPPGSSQALSGRIELVLESLAFVELLTPEVANAKGRLAADYRFGGTLAEPALDGALTLKDFSAEIPTAGLRLHDGDVSLRAIDAQRFVLEGRLKSGEGTLVLSGSGGLDPDAPFEANIKGENFLAADIPAARVVISPDLVIARGPDNIRIGGSLEIPQTDVDLARLPGGGVSKKSPDVVVTDAEQPEPGAPLPLIVGVDVKLGRQVKLAGLGLDGRVRGQLRVDQRPGKLATGTGTLNVSGTYKAYGQDLEIESGRLLFAGTALDNPGLDIRAVRKILGESGDFGGDTVTAGLQVRGTAQSPVLTVFSNPTMEQSEALSYLVTGKPLSSLKSGEGDMLGTAARALGSAGGDLLAKGIGARMGVDAGVSDNAALGGAAFTVGKYLSPKLYLSYGVGLFTPGEVVSLKYLFNRRWNFEAQNATTGNRAGINYRYER